VDVFVKDVFEAGAGHEIIASIEKKFWNSGLTPNG
jgi:hypothetical protein